MIFNNKYEQKALIGKSGFNIVYKVLDKESNNFYALKFITNIKNNEINNYKERYKKEIEVIKKIKSKYIMQIKDNFYDEINKGYCIVMELCDSNLRKILEKNKPKGLSLNIINKIFEQLNEVFKIMVERNYIHGNLKPENILIKYINNNINNFDIKLTGFESSINDINSSIQNNSIFRTLNYLDPKIETCHYNNKCDLWSLGAILYELYTNQYIFYSENLKEQNVNRNEGKIVKQTDNQMINKLIQKLIQIDINKRIQWEEYFIDEFFNSKIKIVNLKSPLLKLIFSFLNEEKKLNIIIYNKNIQKKLEVKIENYIN